MICPCTVRGNPVPDFIRTVRAVEQQNVGAWGGILQDIVHLFDEVELVAADEVGALDQVC
jgi:hypothetical protein